MSVLVTVYSVQVAIHNLAKKLLNLIPDRNRLQIAHVGDSAALVVSGGKVRMLTMEHTVAARMVAEQWQDASEAIPLTAHHTLTQCIGQDLYIDQQVLEVLGEGRAVLLERQMADELQHVAEREGIPDLIDRIAVEKNSPDIVGDIGFGETRQGQQELLKRYPVPGFNGEPGLQYGGEPGEALFRDSARQLGYMVYNCTHLFADSVSSVAC